jgi:hypothetical protein
LDRLQQRSNRNTVEDSKLGIEQNALAAQYQDRAGDLFGRNYFGHRVVPSLTRSRDKISGL